MDRLEDGKLKKKGVKLCYLNVRCVASRYLVYIPVIHPAVNYPNTAEQKHVLTFQICFWRKKLKKKTVDL